MRFQRTFTAFEEFNWWRTGPSTGHPIAETEEAALTPPFTEKIQHDGENDAQQYGSCEREVEGRVFATIYDVAGQAAEWEMGASEKKKYDARDYKNESEDDEKFSEIRHFVRNKSGVVMSLKTIATCLNDRQDKRTARMGRQHCIL
jgi:hypothetical protein